jgi:hypothetical protein
MHSGRIFDSESEMGVTAVLPPFHSSEEGKVITTWESAVMQNPKMFNGNQIVVEVTEDGYIIMPVKYAQALASGKGVIAERFVVAGVAAAIITKDDKLIVGSRDAARDKVDSTKYPLQVPNGGLDFDVEQVHNLQLLHMLHAREKPDEQKLSGFNTKQQKYASLDYRAKFGENRSQIDFKDFLLNEGLR